MTDRFLSRPEDIIEEASNGRMFILVDDEDRENEGDLVIPAQMATPAAINFMATHGRGLICLTLTSERCEQLGLDLMSRNNGTRHETAFTVSIEAREGVSTGISAADRARTIMAAINPANGPDAIVSPGHVFPLAARPGGVLVRAGHTEAAVDIARLAGLNPSGVICEIMNEDGTMARLGDLIPFAQRHDLRIGTIRDLIAYRRRYDHLVERVDEYDFVMPGSGEWRAISYRNTIDDAYHMVLVKGDLASPGPVLTRMHSLSLFDDVLGCDGPRRRLLQRTVDLIAAEGRGVIVILRSPTQLLLRVPDARKGTNDPDMDPRAYGVGAQILADLDLDELTLLSNASPNLVALEGWGIRIAGQRRIPD